MLISAAALGVLLSATAGQSAKPEVLYRGRNQSIDDPPCILAVDKVGQPFLLFAAEGDFKRIEAKSKLQLSADGPALAEGSAFISGDRRQVVGHDGRGLAFMSPRMRDPDAFPERGNHWKISEWSLLGPWKPSDQSDQPGAVDALSGRNGIMWAVGYATDAQAKSARWVVRRRGSDGVWRQVDSQPGYATAIHVRPDGSVFVAGVVDGEWTLRRSADGKSWTTVDRYRAVPRFESVPQAIAADARGNVHVVGYADLDNVAPEEMGEQDATHWIVRSSSDGGTRFTTTDDFNPKKVGEAKADDVVFLPAGDAIVVGAAGVPLQRIIRVLRRGEKRWQTLSATQRPVWEHRFAITPGPSGTIYVAGVIQGKEQQECLIERIGIGSR